MKFMISAFHPAQSTLREGTKEPPPSGTQKIAIVMMGGPASGKSSLVKGIMGSDFEKFVNVNPDDVKEKLPEWGPGLDASVKDTAYMVHDESSDIASGIYNAAIERGLNLIVDGTGKDVSKHKAKIEALQKEGYHVTVLMPDVDAEDALKRAKERAERTGRYVPDDIVLNAHAKIPGNFETIARAAESFGLFDTRGRPPRLVWSGNKGEKDQLHDPKFVAKFQRRAGARRRHAERRAEQAKTQKSLVLPASLYKAEKKPPYKSVLDLAQNIAAQPEDKLYPEDKLPKQYDRNVGVYWTEEMAGDQLFHE